MSSKIKILDASLTELATLNVASSATRTEKINSDNTLSFSFPIKKAASAYVTADTVYELDGDYFDTAYYKKEQQSSGRLMVSVEAEHVSYRLNDAAYNVDYFTQTGTPTAILTEILSGTGFAVGTVDFSAVVTFSLQEATSRRALLMQFIAYIGGEVLFEGFTVSMLAQRGSATPKPLTVGKDITVMSKAVDKRTLDDLGNPTISYACGVFKGASLALGDVVTLDYDKLDIDVSLRVVSKSYDPYNPNNVSVEIGNYVNALEDDLYRIETSTVAKDKIYNGTRIGPTYGFEAIRSDNKARSFFRSDGMAIQTGDGTGTTWTNKMWVEVDPGTGAATLKFDGVLSASVVEALSAVITPNLYAEKATIAELTVDQLDTGTKVQNYLNENTGDVNYIKIVGQTVQFITASTSGGDEQATNRSSAELYWTDDTYTAATTTVTAYPVMIYVYTEAVKAEISFYDDSGTYVPRLVMGAGTGTGDNDKLIVYKTTGKAVIEYYTSDGNRRALEMSTDGILSYSPTANGLRNIAVGSTAPADPQTNDLWIDTEA